MSGDARTTMLAAIRAAVRAGTPAPGLVTYGHTPADAHGAASPGGAPPPAAPRDAATLVATLVHRIADYRAHVETVTAATLPAAIAARVAARGARTLVVPRDLPAAWRPVGVAVHEDDGLAHAALDAIDGVITACALAIAETGTLVLDGGPAQGRRAISLLPDWHCCVVRASQVVDDVPEAMTALAASGSHRRPLTMISGPSATSDIEFDRVEGVHGPRTLEVLVVTDA